MKKDEIDLRENNIIFNLNSYEDIFSDFDLADYKVRALSDDFIIECRKASIDKKQVFNLIFSCNNLKRSKKSEKQIIKRLENHFDKHYKEKKKEFHQIKKTGFMWFLFGGIIMSCAAFFHYKEGFLFDILTIFSEPAGWFMFWEGLAKVFIESKKELPHYRFYEKLSKAKIIFSSKYK
ncbi:MAG: hypothetical protein AB7V77_04060 [Candidatus Woesearchaeota archaeon]